MLNVTLCLNGVDHPWRRGRARRLTAVCCGQNPGFANLCCGEAVRGEIRSWAAVTILQHVACSEESEIQLHTQGNRFAVM